MTSNDNSNVSLTGKIIPKKKTKKKPFVPRKRPVITSKLTASKKAKTKEQGQILQSPTQASLISKKVSVATTKVKEISGTDEQNNDRKGNEVKQPNEKELLSSNNDNNDINLKSTTSSSKQQQQQQQQQQQSSNQISQVHKTKKRIRSSISRPGTNSKHQHVMKPGETENSTNINVKKSINNADIGMDANKSKADNQNNENSNGENQLSKQFTYAPIRNPWELDPALNIPPPKENEKRLRDFCSSYRVKRTPEQRRQMALEREERKQQKLKEKERLEREQKQQEEDGNNENENKEKSKTGGPEFEIVNGEIRIRDDSLNINKHKTAEQIDAEMDNVVEEDNVGLTATYASFTKWSKRTEWTVERTRLFYKAIRQCGTDFDTMQWFFNGEMDRKQLKKKYLAECRRNPTLIDLAMNPKAQLPFDLTVFGIEGEEVDAVKQTIKPMAKPGETIVVDSPATDDSKAEQPKQEEKIKQEESPPTAQPPKKEMTLEEKWGFDATEEDAANIKETNDEMLDGYGIQTEEEAEPVLVSLLPGSMKTKSKKPKFKANKSKAKFSKGKSRKK